jgi:glutamate-1-semialdehyde aminotransferase
MLPPSQQEAWFVSAAHGEDELRATLEAARLAFDRTREGGRQ